MKSESPSRNILLADRYGVRWISGAELKELNAPFEEEKESNIEGRVRWGRGEFPPSSPLRPFYFGGMQEVRDRKENPNRHSGRSLAQERDFYARGEYQQVEDDYLDGFGVPETHGRAHARSGTYDSFGDSDIIKSIYDGFLNKIYRRSGEVAAPRREDGTRAEAGKDEVGEPYGRGDPVLWVPNRKKRTK